MSKYIIISCTVLSVILVALGGCNLAKMVDVDVPEAVKAVVGDQDINLSEAEMVVAKWNSHVEINTKALQESLQDSQERYQFLHSLVDTGLVAATTASEGFPYGGILLSILTGAAGLAAPQPKFMRKSK